MYDTIYDIQRNNGNLYISSQVKKCEIHAEINGKGMVFITFAVMCDRKDAKEVPPCSLFRRMWHYLSEASREGLEHGFMCNM